MTPIKALVVDDSAVIRRLLVKILNSDPEIEVVGTAADGRLGLQRAAAHKPDVIVLDVEMPVMNGFEALTELRKTDQQTTVIMFSALTERGADATLDALGAGADDYETKPSKLRDPEELVERIRDGLIRKIKALVRTRAGVPAGAGRLGPSPFDTMIFRTVDPVSRPIVDKPTTSLPRRVRRPSSSPVLAERGPVRGKARPAGPGAMALAKQPALTRVDVLVIGVSTGGPAALKRLLPKLQADFPVPVVIVQHMPPVFTKRMAERLDRICPLHVQEVYEGAQVHKGQIWIAPGDYHIEVSRSAGGVVLKTNQEPKENYSRPAVDVLFRSVSAVYGRHILALMLTGMGEDGLRGCQGIAEHGGQVIAQDQDTSVVWGMPGAVAKAGLAEAVLPLDDIVSEITRRMGTGRNLALGIAQKVSL